MSLPHLSPEAVVLLDLPVAERKGKISEMKWIPYARARRIGQKMHDLLHHPPSYRMPNLLVVGDTGNSKIHIIRRFEAAHPSYTRERDGHLIAPVLYLQPPPDADEKSFYHTLLWF